MILSADGLHRHGRMRMVAACLSIGISLVTSTARADDVTIDSATTAPLSTSSASNSTPGNITVSSSGSIAVAAGQGAVTIDSSNSVSNAGTISANASGGVGVSVRNATAGSITNNGSVTTGIAGVIATNGTITGATQGSDALQVFQSIGGGIFSNGTIAAIGPETVLFTTGSVPADIVLGDVGGGSSAYGFVIDGTLTNIGGNTGAPSIAIRAYATGGHTINFSDGITNMGGSTISATADNAYATAINLGAGVIVPKFNNGGTITATTGGTAGGTAMDFDIGNGATFSHLDNSGTLNAIADVKNTDAIVIRDLSGTLSGIDNSGTISAIASGSGRMIALDLSASSTNISLLNSGTIKGDIFLGSGNDALVSGGGSISGNLNLGGGTNTVALSNGALLTGSNTLSPGATLALSVDAATLSVTPPGFAATTASFTSDATLLVNYSSKSASAGGLTTTGTATLDGGTNVGLKFSSYAAHDLDIPVVSAGTLVLSGGLASINIGSINAGYTTALSFDPGNPNALVLSISRKSAADLGMTRAVAQIYNASANALASDDTIGSAVGNLSSVEEIRAAYQQLLPDLTGAREDQAINLQDLSSSFVSDRLDGLRQSNEISAALRARQTYGRQRAGLWVQEGYMTDRSKAGDFSQSYRGASGGGAIGYDWPDKEGDLWGGSFAYIVQSYKTAQTPKDDLTESYVAQAYRSVNWGPLFWDSMGTFAVNHYSSYRTVTVASVSKQADGSWLGEQAGLTSRAGATEQLGPLSFTPSLGLSYLYLRQASHDETGGGGIDLSVDGNSFQSLRAEAELRTSVAFGTHDSTWAPYMRGGISQELLSSAPQVSGHFAQGLGGAFDLSADRLDRQTPFAGGGLAYSSDYFRLALDYTGEFGKSLKSTQASGTVSMIF